MKIIINNEQTNNKELYYEEGFWTGKRTIIYDGVRLTKIKRNLFEYKNGETTEQVEVVGNQIVGITIKMLGKEIEVARKLAWYEIVMAVLVFIPCVLFGAIGGAIGGALGCTNIVIIRNVKKLYMQVIISTMFMIVSLLLSYIIAVLIFKAISPLF